MLNLIKFGKSFNCTFMELKFEQVFPPFAAFMSF